MQIKFIGTGGAFDYKYGNSAVWIVLGGKRILVDCGYTVYPQLKEKGLIDQIDYLLITHLHNDHTGSLATAILDHKHICQNTEKLVIASPSKSFEQDIVSLLSHSLSNPYKYVSFVSTDSIEGLGVIDTMGLHVTGMKSFAYYFKEGEELILYSGDIGQPHILFAFLEKQRVTKIRVFHEICFFEMDGIHTYYKNLFPYIEQYEIYGYHINPLDNPKDNPIPLVYDHKEFML